MFWSQVAQVSVTFQDDITQVIPKGWIEAQSMAQGDPWGRSPASEEVATRWTGQRNSMFSKEATEWVDL